MLDADDLQVIAYYGIRVFGLWMLIIGTSVTCGAAWRLFEFLRG